VREKVFMRDLFMSVSRKESPLFLHFATKQMILHNNCLIPYFSGIFDILFDTYLSHIGLQLELEGFVIRELVS
jgi:hypothetical protein